MSTSSSDQRFSSRLGLILSVLGIAVGTGNIWRFPRIAAQNSGEDGAGAFLLAWVIFLVLWSVPLIIAEYALGRKGRQGVIGSMMQAAGDRFAWMGAFIGFVAAAIMFYYSVVAGWCVFYFVEMLTNPLPLTVDSAQGVWDGFQSGGRPVMFHGLAMGLGALAVWKGVKSIETVNKVLIPALLLIILVALGRTLTLPGAGEGIAFLFSPTWSTLAEPKLWLEALTQNAWDTGAGWGLIMTYAAYMRRSHGVVQNAIITGVGNNAVSLISATIIFGTVFAVLGSQMDQAAVLDVMQTSGPASTGLTFVWMPQLFAQMPGGRVFATLFFLGLAFAAFSSLISMIEMSTRMFVDAGLQRRQAIVTVCAVAFTLGIPSALYLDFFSNQDFVWGVALMLCGAFVAFAVIRYGTTEFRMSEIDGQAGDWNAGRLWDFIITYLVPLQAIILLVWWLWQATTDAFAVRWYDPTEPFSVMTCLVQWGLVMGVFYMLNDWLARRTRSSRLER